MKSKIIFICMLLLISCSLSCAMAADADNSTQDAGNVDLATASNDNNLAIADNDNLTASTGSFDELQNIVNHASKGSTIILDKDYDGSYNKHVTLSKALTIDGNGHTIDCKDEKCCFAFEIKEGIITLKNLKIKNGHNNDDNLGGAIYISGESKVTIENCTFENNWAKSYGGAVYDGAKEGTLTVINSKFIGNKANNWDGGAIYSKRDVIIENSYFKSNAADVDGGAVYVIKTLDAINSTFISNRATGALTYRCYGGAICVKDDIYLENCELSDNFAENYGGAVYGYKDVLVLGSKFDGNSARQGGAIYGGGPRVIVDKSIFSKNSARSGHGGAIYADKCAHAGNSTFAANTATSSGGAIYTEFIQFSDNTLFVNNSAKNHGGAVYTNTIENYITRVDFENNEATDDYGGAIYINKESGDVYFINCRFSKNHAHAGDGGAIYSDSGSTDIHLHGCIFTDNYAEGGAERRFGGAIRLCSKLYVYNSTFIGNWAENRGGAIYAPKLEYIRDSTFISNYAKKAYGGAVYVDKDCPVQIERSYFEGNYAADDYGGAIYTQELDYIRDSTFISNHASKRGGAVYVNDKCNILIERSYFEANEAKGGYGGAIFISSSGSHLEAVSNAYINNWASESGRDIYNYGYYDRWSYNWWGVNDPTFDKRIVEHRSVGSDVNFKDEHPIKMDMSGQSEGCTLNAIPFTVTFTNTVPDYTYEKITITSDKNYKITGREVSIKALKFNMTTNESGNHKITVKLNSQTLTYDVTVLKNSIIGQDLVKYYQDNLTYSAVFFDGKDIPLVEGSPVSFMIGDEEYIMQVCENGVATLDVNLEPGIYTVKAINKVTGHFLTNVITVKERELVYNINDTFIMKFVSDKSLDNTTVTFRIAGKTFEANITNGIAYLLLDFAPGTYKFDVIYDGQVLTNNLTILNAYSVVDMGFSASDTYGTLLPIYANETLTRIGNTMYSVLGEDTYRYIMPDNTAFIVYNTTASNSAELTNVLKKISKSDFKADVIIINLKPTTYTVKNNFWRDQEWYYLIHLTHGKLFINGNGAVIDDEYRHNFIASETGTSIVISDLTLKRFYRCFLNNGEVYCKDSYFVKNDPRYWATNTPGGVIHNKNTVTFERCVFDHNRNNWESPGIPLAGVLYAGPKSVNTFIKCTFKSEYDNIRTHKGSVVVIYDDSLDAYLNLKSTGYLDTQSGFDVRSMDTLNVDRTKTYNINDVKEFSRFARDDAICDIICDATKFIVNLDNNKEYKLTEDDIESIADSSREWRTRFQDWYTARYALNRIHERYFLDVASKPIVINGHGSTISLTDGGQSHDYSFAYVPYKGSLTLVNLTLSGFNTAIVNQGTLIIINCTFKNNVIHHKTLSGDDGGAIRNFATVYCYNSTFEKNGAVQGGAYYSSGNSAEGVFYNCTFTGNVYKSNWVWKNNDPNAFFVDGGSVVKLIKCNVKSSEIKKNKGGLVLYRENLNNSVYTGQIDSVVALYKLSKIVCNNGKYDVFNVTLARGDYGIFQESDILFKMDYGTLILDGNGSRIFVQNPKINDEAQFATVSARAALLMNRLTIEGFNTAITNKGNLEIYNSMFSKNKVKYVKKDDYGGAIVNEKSLLVFNSSFVDNYAKYGGAIYNKASAKFINCSFSNNKAYYKSTKKVDIYSKESSASIVFLNDNLPIVVEKFPMPAWADDLQAVGFKLLIIAISAGVGYGVSALGVSAGFLISRAASIIIGGGLGAIRGWLYSNDHQDYSKFWSKVLEGVSDGLNGVSYGGKVFKYIVNYDPEAKITDVQRMQAIIKENANGIYSKFISKTVGLGKTFANAYAKNKNYDSIKLYWFFKSMGR